MLSLLQPRCSIPQPDALAPSLLAVVLLVSIARAYYSTPLHRCRAVGWSTLQPDDAEVNAHAGVGVWCVSMHYRTLTSE